MAAPSTPTNMLVQTGNIQNYITWDSAATATSYDVERSTDNITFASVATPTVTEYLDASVSPGIMYWYRVKAVNGDGPSAATDSQNIVPAQAGEMALLSIRRLAKERADMVNSSFISDVQWNSFINQAMFELYDLLTTVYEDYNKTEVTFTTVAGQDAYDLPNGVLYSGARPFYKILGVDIGLNSTPNGWVTANKFNFIDRNKYFYTITTAPPFGNGLEYRVVGNKLTFIPAPNSTLPIRMHYIPRLRQLLKDSDVSEIGISGWLEYVITRTAKYALDKEESDSTTLTQELLMLKQRIEESASNRDAGRPDKISDIRTSGAWNGWSGYGGWGNPYGWY